MTGLKSLPEIDKRLVLWRNTIQLFRKLNRPAFEGPFHKCGYEYKIEAFLKNNEENTDYNPDIVASNEDSWLIIELTNNSDKSKNNQVLKYKKLSGRNLSIYGLESHKSDPEILTSRIEYTDDKNCCQIIVKTKFEVYRLDFLTYNPLLEALRSSQGIDLSKLPSIPITLVPESKNMEIRRGIADIVMTLFKPGGEGLSSRQMAELGLERLVEKTGEKQKNDLAKKIEVEMNILIAKSLKGYLSFKSGKYISTIDSVKSAQRRESIESRIHEWAYDSQSHLSKFVTSHAINS